MMNRLNLCSGTSPWNNCFNVDTNRDFNPDWCGDVLYFPDLAWEIIFASPPCTYLSKVRARWGYPAMETIHAQHIFEFCLNYARRNSRYYLVENPPGLASKMYPGAKMIHYSAYGARIKKPTMIWTNIPGFEYMRDNGLSIDFQNYKRDAISRSRIPSQFVNYVEGLLDELRRKEGVKTP